MRKKQRALIVVDVQVDFCPGGAMAVPDGDAVVPIINSCAPRFDHLLVTQDWHTPDHLSFTSLHPGKKPYDKVETARGDQVLRPEHCVQGTAGASVHPRLEWSRAELVLRKGFHRELDSYSVFFENDNKTPTGLDGYLTDRGFEELYFAGLATDFGILYSVLDATRLGYKVKVIEDACRGVNVDGSVAAAWDSMKKAGAELLRSTDVPDEID